MKKKTLTTLFYLNNYGMSAKTIKLRIKRIKFFCWTILLKSLKQTYSINSREVSYFDQVNLPHRAGIRFTNPTGDIPESRVVSHVQPTLRVLPPLGGGYWCIIHIHQHIRSVSVDSQRPLLRVAHSLKRLLKFILINSRQTSGPIGRHIEEGPLRFSLTLG